MTNTQVESLYQAAVAADDKFQAAVEKQFGEAMAGDMRYHSNKHNAETVSAREEYRTVSKHWLAALDEWRESGKGSN